MVQTFLGYEVIEGRFKYLKGLGVKDLEFKLENTPECVVNLRRAFRDNASMIEIFPEIAMVCFWYGDADGDPNTYTVIENGKERVYQWHMMEDEDFSKLHERRVNFAKEKGYV